MCFSAQRVLHVHQSHSSNMNRLRVYIIILLIVWYSSVSCYCLSCNKHSPQLFVLMRSTLLCPLGRDIRFDTNRATLKFTVLF